MAYSTAFQEGVARTRAGAKNFPFRHHWLLGDSADGTTATASIATLPDLSASLDLAAGPIGVRSAVAASGLGPVSSDDGPSGFVIDINLGGRMAYRLGSAEFSPGVAQAA